MAAILPFVRKSGVMFDDEVTASLGGAFEPPAANCMTKDAVDRLRAYCDPYYQQQEERTKHLQAARCGLSALGLLEIPAGGQ